MGWTPGSDSEGSTGSSGGWVPGGTATATSTSKGPSRDLANASIRGLKGLKGEKARRFKDLVQRYGADIPEDELKRVGLSGGSSQSFGAKAKRTGLGALSAAADILSRPGQAVLSAGRAGAEAKKKGLWATIKADVTGAWKGLKGDTNLTFRQALGKDPEGQTRKGFGSAAENFLGGLVTDPLSYLTLGAGTAAKQGLKTAGKTLGEDAARQIARTNARRALSEADQAVLREALAAGGEKAARKQARALGLEAGRTGAHRIRPVAALWRPGASRSSMVLGKLAEQLDRTDLGQDVHLAMRQAADALTPRRRIGRELGSEAAEAFDTARAGAQGHLSTLVSDKAAELNAAVKAGSMTARQAREAFKEFAPGAHEQADELLRKSLTDAGIGARKGKGKYVFPEAVAAELQGLKSKGLADHGAIGRLADRLQGTFRRQATMLPGFQARNIYGDVSTLATTGGLSAGGQRTAHKLMKALRSGKVDELTPELQDLLKGARERGVLAGDIFHLVEDVNVKGKFGRAASAIRRAGGRASDELRLGGYVTQLGKVGDADEAARLMRKTLHDYSDLTKTEKHLRAVVPFYTFLRHNTPQQLKLMASKPGVFANYLRALQAAGDATVAPEGPLPGYAVNQGQLPVGGRMLAGLDMPFMAALKAIEAPAQAATLVPGLKSALPKKLRPEEGGAEAARGLLNVPGGGVVGLVKAGAEIAGDKNFFSGAPVKDPKTHLLTSLFPAGALPGRLSSDQKSKLSKALSMILGVSNTEVTEGRQSAEEYRRLEMLRNALGSGAITLKELEKLGEVPKQRAQRSSGLTDDQKARLKKLAQELGLSDAQVAALTPKSGSKRSGGWTPGQAA